MKKELQISGFSYAILDMITYGLFPVFTHYFVLTITPLLFAGITTLIGSFPLILILKLKKEEKELYSKKYIKPLLIIALLSTIASLFIFLGTKLTSGINTGLLIQLEPFYAIILSYLFLKEIIKKEQIIATLIMAIGAVIIVFKGLDKINIGDLLIVIAPVFFQISHIPAKTIIKKITNIYTLPAARLFYSGVILTILAGIFEPSSFKELFIVKNIIAILFFAFIFRSLDLLLWYQVIKRISISKASAVIPLAAAISFLGSILILKENVDKRQYYGLLFILGGLIWLSILHIKLSNKK